MHSAALSARQPRGRQRVCLRALGLNAPVDCSYVQRRPDTVVEAALTHATLWRTFRSCRRTQTGGAMGKQGYCPQA